MSEEGTKAASGALAWVRVVGWQLVAMVGVVLVGVGIFRMCGAWTRQTNASTQVAEDCGQISGFIADCVPVESKGKVKELINEAVNFGAEVGLEQIKQGRRYFERRKNQGMDVGQMKGDYRYGKGMKEARPKAEY